MSLQPFAMLDGNILCEPIEEDHRPGYRSTATGTFGQLLTGTSVDSGASEWEYLWVEDSIRRRQLQDEPPVRTKHRDKVG